MQRRLTYTHVFAVAAALVAVFTLLASLRDDARTRPPPEPVATHSDEPDGPNPLEQAIVVLLEFMQGPNDARGR